MPNKTESLKSCISKSIQELQPRVLNAFIISPIEILGIFFANIGDGHLGTFVKIGWVDT